VIEELLLATLRLSVPLILAAYGGLLSERSGVANIALEANLLFSAFAGASIVALSGNLWVGAIGGVAVSAFVGFLFAVTCVFGRGDQIVVGTAFNLLAFGLTPVLSKSLFGVSGSTPSLDFDQRFHHPFAFFLVALVVLLVYEFMFRKTRHGLRINAAGENPAALATMGVNHKWVRVRAVVEGSIVTGIGGIYLSLGQGSGFARDMAAGRGFIALAALIFGAWKPVPTFLACLFFAFTDAIQIQLQGQKYSGVSIPNQFIQIIPYVATLLVLVVYARKIAAPAAINRDVNL
jgi:general nucleoside transport system permease protein